MSDWKVRKPTDDIEKFKVDLAIANGAGISIEKFIEKIIGEKPDKALVEATRLCLSRAQEESEAIDIETWVKEFIAWRENFA
jgi:hypothetical protein